MLDRWSEGETGVLFVDGRYAGDLPAGRYAFWRDAAAIKVYTFDSREQILDIQGQEIRTDHNITLRINAGIPYRIEDPCKLAESTADAIQTLKREVLLAIKTELGSQPLESLLSQNLSVIDEALERSTSNASHYGIRITRGADLKVCVGDEHDPSKCLVTLK